MGLCGRMPHGLRGTMRVATLVVLAALWAPAPTLGVAAHGARGDNLGGRHAAAEPAPSPVPPSPAPHREECCWCDRDTHNAHRVTVDADGAEHELVFSDEFSTPGRDFANGNDKRWTALNKSDYTNASPVRYTPDAVTTVSDRGAMVLVNRTDNSETRVFQAYARPVNAMRIETKRITDKAYAKAVDKTFTSGMVQSWDKFCFTGGVIEVSAKFPMGLGFWPAIWLFGNLVRLYYVMMPLLPPEAQFLRQGGPGCRRLSVTLLTWYASHITSRTMTFVLLLTFFFSGPQSGSLKTWYAWHTTSRTITIYIVREASN
ncbi:hypothetical protein T492DRAFT_62662 [Pavlovales sp. CCMP2436]|nr:hypothetical protein T492DRAFT_62662 [Pavlovales sp. CCMP2436]